MNKDKERAIQEFIDGVTKDGASFVEPLISKFDKTEGTKEKALALLFKDRFAKNDKEEEVLIKVVCMNEFYSAGLNSNEPLGRSKSKIAANVLAMSSHIANLAKGNDLDGLIERGDKEAVELIRWVDVERFCDAYSFATKYCNWHNPEKYPIVDGYSKAMVYYLCRELGERIEDEEVLGKITQAGLNNYPCFCRCFDALNRWINRCCGKDYACKQIDKLLWQYAAREKKDSKLKI